MPEQITKYPDVTLQVLKSAGARCGEGVEQKILKQCPAERFCSLPGGEMCIYGVAEVPAMTQIKAADLAPVVCPVNAAGLPEVGGFAMLLAMGVWFGAFWRRRK